jgi:hypothetical protein
VSARSSYRTGVSSTCRSSPRRAASWRRPATERGLGEAFSEEAFDALRVFNPTVQGERFDPAGDYVRRYIPELGRLRGKSAHRPWTLPTATAPDYPRPVVDHDEERRDALVRYDAVKRSRS